MDVFLQRQPNGSCSAPVSASHLHQSAELRATDTTQLVSEVQRLKCANIRLVSVRRQRVLQLGKQELLHVLAANGMGIGTIGYAGGFTGTLGPGYEAAVADTQRALHLAAELGAKSLVVVPGCRGQLTWNHAGKTIQAGLERCLDDALRFRIDMHVALNPLLGSGRDVYHPQEQRPLDWIHNMDSHRIRALMVLRGLEYQDQLPDCWRYNMLAGGILRLSRRCCEKARIPGVLASIVRGLNQPLPQREPRPTSVASM